MKNWFTDGASFTDAGFEQSGEGLHPPQRCPGLLLTSFPPQVMHKGRMLAVPPALPLSVGNIGTILLVHTDEAWFT